METGEDPGKKSLLFCFGFLIIGFATNDWFNVFSRVSVA